MSTGPIPELPCACATVRRAARVLTQLYAQEFEGLLEGTQYSLLAAVNCSPGINQATLAGILALGKTTLSRNLGLMKRRRWVTSVAGKDRREQGLRITAEGLRLLESARPAWRRAQDRLKNALGGAAWKHMFAVVDNIARAAGQAQQTSSGARRSQAK